MLRSGRASRIGGTPIKVTAHAAIRGCYLIQPLPVKKNRRIGDGITKNLFVSFSGNLRVIKVLARQEYKFIIKLKLCYNEDGVTTS